MNHVCNENGQPQRDLGFSTFVIVTALSCMLLALIVLIVPGLALWQFVLGVLLFAGAYATLSLFMDPASSLLEEFMSNVWNILFTIFLSVAEVMILSADTVPSHLRVSIAVGIGIFLVGFLLYIAFLHWVKCNSRAFEAKFIAWRIKRKAS